MLKLLLFFFSLMLAFEAAAVEKNIKLACYELNPYVSGDRSEHGYLYEVVMRAFERAGYKVSVEFFPPLRAKKLVETGEYEALIPTYSSMKDAAYFLYSQPILGSQIEYFQLRESPGASSSKTQGKEARKDPGNLEPYFGEEEGIIKSSSDHIVRLIEMLSSKTISIAIADRMQVADVLVNRRPKFIGKVEFIEPILAVKDFHVAFSRKYPHAEKTLAAFDKGLADLQEDGEYDRILARYGFQIKESNDNVLNIGSVANSDIERIRELSHVFLKERPSVKINWYLFEENLLRRSILSSLALGDRLFDIITITNYDSSIYAENKWIEPLETGPAYDVDDVIPSIRAALTHKGKLYALPFYGESSMTFYRKDLFAKNHLKMPEQPTYKDIRNFAQKLHQPEKEIYGICLRGKAGWGENMTLVNLMLNVFGGRWFDPDKKPVLTSKVWQETIGFYLDLLQNYGPPDAFTRGYQENLELFAAGKCAQWIDATVAASYLLNNEVSRVSHSAAFAKSPTMRKSEGSHSLAVWAFAVPSSSKKKELAREFVNWATSKKYIQLVARQKGWLAVPPGTRRSTYASAAYKSAAPFSSFVANEMESAIPKGALDEWGQPERGPQFLGVPEYAALGTSVGINIALALQKKITLEKALELSQQDVRQIMRDNYN